ncbi:MAG: hypothetical protein EBY28_17835, partial [Betaproteobacteria bacterium]|nr:hypothetical protein [Betaproteobacteria bacterium]
METSTTTPLLHGIRVLDFGRYIAGPYCAAMLADYGADVIRIEKREGSEDRFPSPVGGGVGALFLQMNRNKRAMTLDPASPQGREVVARMVRGADVVIANLPHATLVAMGLDYETLCSYRPDIIFVTNTAFGPVGPMHRNVGFDGIGQAMSGGVYMTGTPEQPYRAMVNWVDFGTALHCAFGTMAALMERKRSGKGQMVTGALLATAVTVTNATLIEQAVAKPDRVASGNRGQTAAPSAPQGTAQISDTTGTIEIIAVQGSQRIEPATIRTYLTVREGDPFDPARIDRSIKNLFATGLFADVNIVRQANNTLLIRVVENPIINRISLEGNSKIKDEDL